jgi:hypothetical protein
MGMNSRVGQGQSHLPADVPGMSTALSQEDQLRTEDRLRQQLADDSTEEGQSRRRRRNSSNGCFPESSLASTRLTEARDRRDASNTWSPPISRQEPFPQKDSRQNGGHMPQRCRSKGERHFIKLPSSNKESEDSKPRQDRSRGGAGSRAAGHITCNQTPAYIRGSRPLDWGGPILLLPPLDRTARGAL